MCRADLTERAVEEKDMLVLAKEEENIVVNKPALSQIRSICELATLECYYHNVEKSAKTKGTGLAHEKNSGSNTPELLRLKSTCRM